MMVPKIVSHAGSVVARNRNYVRVLGREAYSKSKRHSPSAVSTTNVLAKRLERRSRTVQSNRTQVYVAHFRKNYHRLLLRN